MENFVNLHKDFGVITKHPVKDKTLSLNMIKELSELIKGEGIDLANYDVCSLNSEWIDNIIHVKFKVVHWRVSSANDVTWYYKVAFK